MPTIELMAEIEILKAQVARLKEKVEDAQSILCRLLDGDVSNFKLEIKALLRRLNAPKEITNHKEEE